MATLVLTATNAAGTVLGAVTASLADSDLTRLGNALNAERYQGSNFTVPQAIRQAYFDWIGDLKSLTLDYEQRANAPPPIPVTTS